MAIRDPTDNAIKDHIKPIQLASLSKAINIQCFFPLAKKVKKQYL